ncbi:MAG: hypothetical protein Q9183_002618 [Haloplaca sp. 2 TL-2023]
MAAAQSPYAYGKWIGPQAVKPPRSSPFSPQETTRILYLRFHQGLRLGTIAILISRTRILNLLDSLNWRRDKKPPPLAESKWLRKLFDSLIAEPDNLPFPRFELTWQQVLDECDVYDPVVDQLPLTNMNLDGFFNANCRRVEHCYDLVTMDELMLRRFEPWLRLRNHDTRGEAFKLYFAYEALRVKERTEMMERAMEKRRQRVREDLEEKRGLQQKDYYSLSSQSTFISDGTVA